MMLPLKILGKKGNQTDTNNQGTNDDREKHLHDINFLASPEELVYRIHLINLK
jgi:hypothetical protein